jgi:MraZ protein
VGKVESVKPISFNGQGFSLLGEKGRFVLPPDFRKSVRDSGLGERVLCLAKHPRWKCLIAFGLGRVSEFEAELDREERIALDRGHDFDRDLRSAQLYGFARVPFDDSGRFVLPDRFFKLGGLADAAFFQGGGKQFTIWNPAELAAMGPGWEDAQAACEELAAQTRNAKGRK